MEEEGKLIDGYLEYLREAKNPGELKTYIYNKIYNSDDSNMTEQVKLGNLIYSRAEQYDLVRINPDNPKRHIISGIGLDVLKMGGYDKWRNLEDHKVKRQIRRENGIYIINNILAGTSIVSILISAILGYHQLTTNDQIGNKLKDLAKQDSIFNKKIETLMSLRKNQTKSKL